MKNRNIYKIEGRGYDIKNLQLIKVIAIFFGSLSLIIISFYINSPDILDLYSKPSTLLAMFLVLGFWLIRIIFLSINGKIDGDPIIYALKDITSIFCLTVIILLFMVNFI